MSRLHGVGLFSLALVFFGVEAGAVPPSGGVLGSTCDCYYFTDCPDDEIAHCSNKNVGHCAKNGKNDGTCLLIPTDSPVPPSELVQAIDLLFDAYLVPIADEDGGRPNLDLLNAVDRVKLTESQHVKARTAAHDALDAVIGFDFEYPLAIGIGNPGNGVGPSRFGNVRAGTEGATAIVEAARAGMTQAILTRNLNAVAGPLESFWASHPDFHPNHTGRYYPHGHDDFDEEIGTPLAGQVEGIRRILLTLLKDGAPLCGDDVRQGIEACDGEDDSACPFVCTTDCTCGFVP